MTMQDKPTLNASALEQKQRELQKLLDNMAEKFASPANHCKISQEEFTTLKQFIYDTSGIFIPPTRRYLLENRLAPRLRELQLDSYGAYLALLQRPGPKAVDEFARLMELITTNETSFYRNTAQLEVFQQILLPELLERKRVANNTKLHIWSAGCSSGEEPYTIGIILHEILGTELPRWRIRITASDISDAVLMAAREGSYTDYSLRSTPGDILNRYFRKEAKGWRIIPSVQKLTQFGKLNLSDAIQIRRLERADFVFCRNVIIYFDQEMKKKVIAAFHERLVPGGYLLIGHSESLHSINDGFRPLNYPGAMVYQKPKGEGT